MKERIKAAESCFIAAHRHEHDYTVLKQLLALKANYRYIGLICPRSKVKTTLKRLHTEGIEVPDSLFAPMGIKLGGNTAAEIAVSIAAEVVALIHDVPANHLRR